MVKIVYAFACSHCENCLDFAELPDCSFGIRCKLVIEDKEGWEEPTREEKEEALERNHTYLGGFNTLDSSCPHFKLK